MIEINRKAYSQVYSIINYLGEEYKNKLPNNLLKFFEMEKETNYVDDINPITPLEEQDLLQDTIDILAMLKLYYWCKNEEESNKLRNLLNENERKYQMKLREKYNPDNLFKNSNLQKE